MPPGARTVEGTRSVGTTVDVLSTAKASFNPAGTSATTVAKCHPSPMSTSTEDPAAPNGGAGAGASFAAASPTPTRPAAVPAEAAADAAAARDAGARGGERRNSQCSSVARPP
jgi:hypothetical protein